MAKTYSLAASEIPERHTQSLYAEIVADFLAQGAESVQVTIEGMKPATLRLVVACPVACPVGFGEFVTKTPPGSRCRVSPVRLAQQ
jgi:hypothetical protein